MVKHRHFDELHHYFAENQKNNEESCYEDYKKEMKKLKLLANKEQQLEVLLLFFVCLFIAFSFGYQYLNEDNYNYAVEEMHAYNQNLYRENINIVGAGYSPRFYANQIMSLLIRILGCSWYGAAAVLIRINYVLYAMASTLLSMKLVNRHRLLCGAMISVCLMTGSLISLAFEINGAPDVFLGTSIPVALLGIACVLGKRKNWLASWIFVSVAGFLHVHEGMWAGSIVGMIWIATCWSERKIKKEAIEGLIVYVISMVLIIAPSLINTASVDEKLFVRIYALIRTPHHLLVSSWGKTVIIQSACLLILCALAAILYCKKYDREKLRAMLIGCSLMTALWVGLLGIAYFSTEIRPSSMLVTMYLPKCFKYITILGAFLLVQYGILFLEKQKWISAVSLLLIPLIPSTGKYFYIQLVLFCVFFFVEITGIQDGLFQELNITENRLLLMVVYLLLLFVMYKRLGKKAYFIYLAFGMILYEFLSEKILRNSIKKMVLPVAGLLLVVISTNGFIFHISRGGVSYIGGREFVEAGMGSSIYSIASAFREKIEGDTVFLADPDSSQSNAFQLVSQKSCYALYKNLPSNKNTVLEWYERIVEARKVMLCSAVELKEFMDEINVEYVLMTAGKFGELEKSGLFEIVVKNEEYAVYLKN